MTHFYLTLPSNSSQQYFPDNTMTDYITKLSSTIELTNEWEVGLAEIMFPRSWYTIPAKGLKVVVDCSNCIDPVLFKTGEEKARGISSVKINVKGGHYSSMEELTQELQESTERAFRYARPYIDGPEFDYKPTAKRMCITLMAGMIVEFPPELEVILGLTATQNPLNNSTSHLETFSGEHSCDLQAGIHALYIYCDLLQFTHVGNIKAPLLRVVDSGGETGDVVTRYYERPRYIPLQKKNFDSIQILIRDDLGDKIQFENGKVLLTLHFRRAYNKYLL